MKEKDSYNLINDELYQAEYEVPIEYEVPLVLESIKKNLLTTKAQYTYYEGNVRLDRDTGP